MNNDLLLKMYVNGHIEEMLKEFEKHSPREIEKIVDDHIIKWIESNKSNDNGEFNAYDYFRDSMKKQQWWRFKELLSSERTRQFIINKAKEQGDDALTDEDWADLRATDY